MAPARSWICSASQSRRCTRPDRGRCRAPRCCGRRSRRRRRPSCPWSSCRIARRRRRADSRCRRTNHSSQCPHECCPREARRSSLHWMPRASALAAIHTSLRERRCSGMGTPRARAHRPRTTQVPSPRSIECQPNRIDQVMSPPRGDSRDHTARCCSPRARLGTSRESAHKVISCDSMRRDLLRWSRLARGFISIQALCLWTACVSPPTSVLVIVDTDAPGRAVSMRALVSSGTTLSSHPETHTWMRSDEPDSFRFPVSFGVAAGSGATDGVVTVHFEMMFAQLGSTTVTARRIARFRFVPHQPSEIRLFFPASCAVPVSPPARCLDPAVTCTWNPLLRGTDGSHLR